MEALFLEFFKHSALLSLSILTDPIRKLLPLRLDMMSVTVVLIL